MKQDKLVYWLQDLNEDFNDVVGKKCANLGQMIQNGLRVPPGFALSIELYRQFIGETGLDKKLNGYAKGLGQLSAAGIRVFEGISENIRSMIEQEEMPETVKRIITDNYNKLCDLHGQKPVPVSVRSAGTESRPGMFETYLNVTGEDEILTQVKRVWSSSYTPRALAFRINKGFPLLADELGVGIIKMIEARASGICFTIDPVTGDDSKIIIEANWGLGEGVVSGSESIDAFLVDKHRLEIAGMQIGRKSKCVVKTNEETKWVDVPRDMQSVLCVAEEEVLEIARIAKFSEEQFGGPQDMEWALDKELPFPENLFWLQSRPAKAAHSKRDTSSSAQLADKITSAFREIDLSKTEEKLKSIRFKF